MKIIASVVIAFAAMTVTTPGFAGVVDIKRHSENVRYDHSKSQQHIQALARRGGVAHSHASQTRVLGLTTGETFYKSSIEGKVQHGDGSVELLVDKINITFGGKDDTVFVAREFPRGSCEFNFVLRHEQEHVKINEWARNTMAAEAAAEVRRAMSGKWTIRARSQAEASSYVDKVLSSTLSALVSKVKSKADRMHHSLDSKDVSRVTSVCGK